MSDLPSVVNSAPLEFNERWRLPFDVVVDIMAVAQRSTISALMKTCHTLYTEGPMHMLRDGVTLTSAGETIKFMTFMLAEDPSRLKYLRRLFLCIQRLAYSEAEDHLVQFLFYPFLKLEALVLRPAGSFLRRCTDPALRTAIGGLMSVKHLVVVGVNAYIASLVTGLPWYLESLSISMTHDVRDVLSTFAPFSATLRTLLINAEPYTPNGFFGVDPGSCRFPRVRTFGIVYNKCIPDLLASSAFTEAFPAITHLQLIPSNLPTTRCRAPDLPRGWELIHSTGSGTHAHGSRSALSSLVECSGSVDSIRALHLRGTLSTLRLWEHIRVDEFLALRQVLKDMCPRRLFLSIELVDAELLFALFRREESAYPACLDLQIVVRGNVEMEHLRCALEVAIFCEPLPTGLVELNLLLKFSSVAQNAEISEIRDALTECAHQASSVAPPVKFACRLFSESDEEDWRWPDIGQRKPAAVYQDVRGLRDALTYQLLFGRRHGEDVDSEDDSDQDEGPRRRTAAVDSTDTAGGLLSRWRVRSETSERSKRSGVLRKLGLRRLG